MTEIVSSMGMFLIDDSLTDTSTPLKEYLDTSKLDYSLDSLKLVDQYLDKVRENIKSFTSDQHIKVIARCGAYCGEVIRKNTKKKFEWIEYDTAISLDPRIKSIGEKSIATLYILHGEGKDFSFPFSKVGKYIQNGPEDSLWGFASMILKGE